MSKTHLNQVGFQGPAEQSTDPDADRHELSRRGLLADDTDRQVPPVDGGFLREVEIRPRSRIRRPNWPSNRMA